MIAAGLPMRATEGRRTMRRQAELWGLGRELHGSTWVVVDKSKVVTNARTAEDSMHFYGVAVDCCFLGASPYPDMRSRDAVVRGMAEKAWLTYEAAAKAQGLTSGADWNGNGIRDRNDFDWPHIQITYGLELPRMKLAYSLGGLERVWEEFDRARGVAVRSEWADLVPELASGTLEGVSGEGAK